MGFLNNLAGSALNMMTEDTVYSTSKRMMIQFMNSLEEYAGNLLLVEINYDKDSKMHECVIEKHAAVS